MKLLDHTKTDQGYKIRIHLEETGDGRIEEYGWTFLPEDSQISEKEYMAQQVKQAFELADITLRQLIPEETIVTEDKQAIAEYDALMETLSPAPVEETSESEELLEESPGIFKKILNKLTGR